MSLIQRRAAADRLAAIFNPPYWPDLRDVRRMGRLVGEGATIRMPERGSRPSALRNQAISLRATAQQARDAAHENLGDPSDSDWFQFVRDVGRRQAISDLLQDDQLVQGRKQLDTKRATAVAATNGYLKYFASNVRVWINNDYGWQAEVDHYATVDPDMAAYFSGYVDSATELSDLVASHVSAVRKAGVKKGTFHRTGRPIDDALRDFRVALIETEQRVALAELPGITDIRRSVGAKYVADFLSKAADVYEQHWATAAGKEPEAYATLSSDGELDAAALADLVYEVRNGRDPAKPQLAVEAGQMLSSPTASKDTLG